MKHWGTVTLVLFAFVIGFASTYSCGGGNSSNAADYALLVHQHDAGDITSGELGITLIPSHSHLDYALSDHSHDDYADSQHIHDSGDLLDGGIHNIHITGRAATAGTAETLDGMDSTDFAEANHSHPALDDLNGLWVRKEISKWISTNPVFVDAGYDEVPVQVLHSGNNLSFIETLFKPFQSFPDQIDVTIYNDNFSYQFYTNAFGGNEHYTLTMNGVIISNTSIMGHSIINGHGTDDGDEFKQWIYMKQ